MFTAFVAAVHVSSGEPESERGEHRGTQVFRGLQPATRYRLRLAFAPPAGFAADDAGFRTPDPGGPRSLALVAGLSVRQGGPECLTR